MASPLVVGHTVNVIIVPGHTPTTAVVVSVDNVRHTAVVNHSTGALASQQGVTMHTDHLLEQTDVQFVRPIGPLWTR